MPESHLIHELVSVAADRAPAAPALSHGASALDYAVLDHAVRSCAAGLVGLCLPRAGGVGIYLE